MNASTLLCQRFIITVFYNSNLLLLYSLLTVKIIAFPCSVYCGRPDIVNAGSWETGYSECRVRGDQI
ncbi:unnamed protein product [Staurois parvus]|uniref:Uncharacterized protein n=1 Tax=Staurois parvus TaxID=386267 RepID=A0ABN9F2H2_9NEOB|nr:unnamed protein product [Staurois parvus]